MSDFDEKIKSLVAGVLQIPAAAVTDELAMKDTEAWDSLKHMELIVSLEQSFDLELSFDEIIRMQSVGEIKTVLKNKAVYA